MKLLIETWFSEDIEQKKQAWKKYRQYLDSIRDKLPKTTADFALADWHYNSDDHKCPHDSWVESINISEPLINETKSERRIDISVRLLGAFHDGNIQLDYKNVTSYKLEAPNDAEYKKYRERSGHGDWLIDEVRLTESGNVFHEVIFRWGAQWSIECEELEYRWCPF